MPEAKPAFAAHSKASPSEPAALEPLDAFDETAPRVVAPIERQDGTTLARLVGVMRRLLAPGGCPWDREQTYETLRKYVLEEACEVIDAIDSNDRGALREELGDLLLQVVFQAELGRREGSFAIDDVIEGIISKLVYRHPHVFAVANPQGGQADAEFRAAADADAVLRNWEKLKVREKGRRGLLAGVPRSMPALTRAQRIGEKVARVGFDWESAQGSRVKVSEELAELDAAVLAGNTGAIEEEMGDLLFALVNLSRHLKVDAEGALRRASDKFTRRFEHVEKRVQEDHGGWAGEAARDASPAPGSRQPGEHLPLEVLDRYWEEAKRAERQAGS
jgi:tetrapyrrole methylase family protein/MazG family protein/ATP diphosphatase